MVVWKTEGPTDLLALLSLGLPEGHTAVCNIFGATETPKHWMTEFVEGDVVRVIHDADEPGQAGATVVKSSDGRERPGWTPRLAERATDCRNVKLPYPIAEKHGADLRDWINEQLETGLERGEVYQRLLAMADHSNPAEKAAEPVGPDVTEAEDDPHRLARVNLHRYQTVHGGSLKFWRDEWWRWKGGKYRKIELSELRAKVSAAIKAEFDRSYIEKVAAGRDVSEVKRVTRSLVGNVIGAMESLCILPSSIEMPSWLGDRSRRNYVAFANGILDLDALFDGRDKEECLLKHSPNWFSGFRLDYEFNPDAECPQWLDYLEYSMEGDKERIALLQEWAGYLLSSSNDMQRFLVLEGEGGNGKTVYFAAITAMLGEENVSHVSIENFGGRFELGTTIGKAANVSGDAGEIDQVAEGVLKQFTGGDIMQFDRKNLQPISARPTAKLMAAWNSRPRIKDKSQGLWRRMLLVPFNRRVERDDRILGMDKPQWWIDQGEAPGIILWAIVGLRRLIKQREFTQSRASAIALSEYQEEQNSAKRFLNEEVDWLHPEILEEEKYKPISDQSGIRSDHLYVKYREWCSADGISPMSNQNFGREIKRMFGDLKYRKQQGTDRFFIYRLLTYTSPDF